MTIRSLVITCGLSLFAVGSTSCMQGMPNQEQIVAMTNHIMSMSDAEARQFVDMQYEPEIQRTFDVLFGSLRGLALETVAAWFITTQSEGWTRAGILSVLAVFGLLDTLSLPAHTFALREALAARENGWNQMKALRAAIATRQQHAAEEQQVFDTALIED